MARWARFSVYFLVSSTSHSLSDDKDLQYIHRSLLRKLYGYSTASTSDAAYIIGGDKTRDVIAEFKNDAWRNLGSLVKPRDSQSSISLNGETMIIGGFTSPAR